MFERIHSMIIKEFILALRDPKMRGIIFVTPIIQLILFGYAVSTDVKDIRTSIIDFDNSPTSRMLVDRFARSGYFNVVSWPGDVRDAREILDKGTALAVIQMNHGFGAEQAAGRTAELQFMIDGSDSNTARIIADYGARIIQAYNRDYLEARLKRLTGVLTETEPIRLETRTWFNENLESRNFYVPGVIATLLALITLLLTSLAVVREKEVGTMEQVIATPIRQIEFILGKTIPFVLIAYADAIMILILGLYWFEIPMRGSVPLLFLGLTLYIMSTTGVGLLISTLCSTQQQAMMVTFFYFNPSMLLSGFVFPIPNMPVPIQYITYANPLRYILIIVRGIFLKGVGMEILWPQMLALLGLGVLALTLATSRMRKTVS